MREIVTCRMVGGREPMASDSSNTESKIGASWVANFIKNSLRNLSGPGDFPFFMNLIALISSPIEYGLSRSDAVSLSTVGTFNFPKIESKRA